jgi:hypothetical protein
MNNSEHAKGQDLDQPLAYSKAEMERSFSMEDKRWEKGAQVKDWLILGGMIAVSLAYHLAIFALQPGLR